MLRESPRFGDTAALGLAGTAAAVGLLYVFRSILWPFALALVIVILIQALARAVVSAWPWADRRVVLLVAGLAALGALVVVVLFVLPGLADLGGDLPTLLRRVDGALGQVSAGLALEDPMTLDVLIGAVDARTVAAWTLSGVQTLVSGLVLTALFVIFLLFTWGTIGRRIRAAAVGRGRGRSLLLVERSIRGVETYLWIQTLTGLMIAGTSALIMYLAGLDHWAVWAAALFMLAYIPFLGVAVGSIAPSLFALLQFPSVWPSLIIFLGIQTVAFVVGNLVTPRLQAKAQNIDPCAGLLAVGGWSIVWGLPGAFLAIPLTLVLMYQMAGTRKLRWIAVLMSMDGEPLPKGD